MHQSFEGVMTARLAFRLFMGVVFLCLPSLSMAQTGAAFGKNKVQYARFDYYYIQSDHFDIYFTEGGEFLAQFAAVAAESAYTSIRKSFRYELVNRIPWVIYNSHNDFQQTNVINQYLDEGIGGVTELFKNRIVVPFEGDFRKFRHVIHHELVHAVINDMFFGGSIQSIIANNITLRFPDWFDEGLAEYEALRWDTNSDMFLRDATVHEYLPPLNGLYGYFAYRGGQSMWWYISRKYGEEKVGEILNRIKSTRSVEAGFKGALGLSIEELSERWQKDQKVMYWPDFAKREEPADYARRITDHRKDGSFYNTSPSISPQGDRIAFISNRDDYFDLYLVSTIDGTIIKKLANGQTTNDFEELHLLTPGISWSPDGSRIAVATKAGEQDAIVLIDVESEDQTKLVLGLDGIFSIDWSPKGDKIAFVGNTSRQSDIYVYDLETKELANLTNDRFSDADPGWSPDGLTIYFVSDRGSSAKRDSSSVLSLKFSTNSVFKVGLDSKKVTRVTDAGGAEESDPVISPDGKKMLFISDKSGINNIYEMNLESGVIRPITNSLSGVYQLSLSADGSKLAFSSLNFAGFDLFVMRNPFERDLKIAEVEMTEFHKQQKPAVVTLAEAIPEDKREEPDSSMERQKTEEETRYGENIEIDFSNYVFSETAGETVPKDSNLVGLPKISKNLDEEGNYKINKYKLNFSPDIIYGNAGYDTFYGVSGSTIMAFSDLLGDHQIVFITNLLLDLKNSDYGLQYYYLPERIDYIFSGFHSARFVVVDDIFGGSLYRFRTYGAGASASYPLSRFKRIEAGVTWYDVSRENLDQLTDPIQRRTVIVPSLSYTHDNSLWGFLSPVNGSRYTLSVFGTPKLGASGIGFVNVMADYRTYLRLGRFYSIGLRLSGGGSFGPNPQKFIIGGIDNWIAPTFDRGFPIRNAEDFLFLQTGTPLRGYNYNAQIGSKYTLFNFELRYPLFAFLQAGPLPIGLQSIGGNLFFDMGSAWTEDRAYRAFTRNAEGEIVTKDLLMGMGTGMRLYFLAFFVRLDIAWAWNYSHFSKPKYYVSFGSDF